MIEKVIEQKYFEGVCIAQGLINVISINPSFVTRDKLEGVEYSNGGVRSFWLKSLERVYNEPPSNQIQRVIDALKDDALKEAEEQSEGALSALPDCNENVALLPEFLTSALMSKWAKMSTVNRMLLFQKTPSDQIFQKPVSKTESVSYVKGNYMIREANAAFLFDWEFVHGGISVGEKGVAVWGTLWATVDGKRISRPAVGYEEINAKMTAQLAIKSATTDAIKKGLSLFGFNSDVYSGEYNE